MQLNIDMLESLIFAAVAVCEDATVCAVPREMQDNIVNLTVCLQRLKEDSEELTSDRWARFLEVVEHADTFIV